MFPLFIGAIVFVGLSIYCWWIEDDFAEQSAPDEDATNIPRQTTQQHTDQQHTEVFQRYVLRDTLKL